MTGLINGITSISGTTAQVSIAGGGSVSPSLAGFSGVQIEISGLNTDTVTISDAQDGQPFSPSTLLQTKAGSATVVSGAALTGAANNATYSVMNFGGNLQITRTGSADTLIITYKGTN